jgi:hypothetical protein
LIQGAQEQSSTGSFYIQLTNVSAGTCTLYGFPGVDLVGGNGASLGMKDVWTVRLAMSGSEKVQTLAVSGVPLPGSVAPGRPGCPGFGHSVPSGSGIARARDTA